MTAAYFGTQLGLLALLASQSVGTGEQIAAVSASSDTRNLTVQPRTPEQIEQSRASARIYRANLDRSYDRLQKGDLVSARAYALEVGKADYEANLILALVALGRGDYSETIELLGKIHPDHFNPLGAMATARTYLAVGRFEDARKLWQWYDDPEVREFPSQSDFPPLDTQNGLAARVLSAYGFEVENYPHLSLPALLEAGKISPKSAMVALGVARNLKKLGRGNEALPFLAIARVFGAEDRQSEAEKLLGGFPSAERAAALDGARANPLRAYQP
ncbi:hypothetical protein EON81_25375 [bacterium]|nr:MAG: hypothetical protein EON81_25375 [bacterium]